MNIPLAAAFLFCPRCGAKIETPGGNPLVCGECSYRHFFGPVAAVAGVVETGGAPGELLLLRRGNEPGKGLLGLPGGFVDAGESVEEGLIREVLEETGLTVTQLKFLSSAPNEYAFRGVIIPVADIFFVVQVNSLEPLRPQSGEIEGFEIQLAAQVDLNELAFPSHRRAIEQYVTHFRQQ